MTTAQVIALAGKGVDHIDATDNVLSLSIAKYQSLGAVTLATADTVTLADTGAAITALSTAISALAGKGIDRIDATDNQLAMTVAAYQALGTVALTAADNAVLADTGVNIGVLTSSAMSAIIGKGIDSIDATDNVLSTSACLPICNLGRPRSPRPMW